MQIKSFSKLYWPYLTILALSFFIIWPTLLPGYFSHHDDLQVMRIFEMRKCFEDLQIPCRWVPDMGYGNGYPLFNYYAVFPYYIGALTSFLIGFVGSAKLLFLLPLVLSGIFMYIFVKEFTGIFPALTAAIFYMFAPFKALDTYVRGDVAESFATTLIPLVFYFIYKLIKLGQIKFMIGLSLTCAAFLLSHNIMTVLFSPLILILFIFWLWQEKFKNWKITACGLLIGIGLSAFFILPAYFEKELVQIDNLTRLDLDFRAHFVTVRQLFFDNFWGYGASTPGTNDTISFQIGWPHWWVVLASTVIVALGILRNKDKKSYGFYFIALIIFLFSIFMTHIRSAFVWEEIPILRFTQFPWRFLALTVFSASLITAIFIQNFGKNIQKYLAIGLITLAVFLNWNFFKPEYFYPEISDQQKLSGKLWQTQQKAAILDYLPKVAVQPREGAPNGPILRSGDATFENFKLKSNSFEFKTSVKTPSDIEAPVFDFPIWKVKVNNQDFQHSNQNYLGRISVHLDKGEYLVSGKFKDTPIRTFANYLTSFSTIVLIYFILYGKRNKKII